MAQAIDQAERERELTKEALAGNIERLEARVRAELDWKARLRRNGLRYAVIGGVVVAAVVGAVVLRAALGGKDDRKKSAPVPTTMQEMAAELATIRQQLDRAKIEPSGPPLWQKIALQGVSAAAGAGGTYAAKRFMARTEGSPEGAPAAH